MPEAEHPRISRITGTTVELRDPVAAGDRRLLLVDAVIREAGGIRKTSDGDVEPIHYAAQNIYDVTDVEGLEAVLADARTARRKADEERNGVQALPGMSEEPIFLIGFSCGHEAFYPEAWLAHEESEDEEESSYWRDQVRPKKEGDSGPCPLCPGKRGDVRAVTQVGLVGAPAPLPGDSAHELEEVTGPDALEEPIAFAEDVAAGDLATVAPWSSYPKADVETVKNALDSIEDPEAKTDRAIHVATYEAAHKNRKRVLDYVDVILDPQEA